MLKRVIFIIFLLVIPIAFSQTGSVTIIQNPLTANEFSTCEAGDGCNLMCPNGDSDCTCNAQKGYICSESEVCGGVLLENWNDAVCCSLECKNSIVAKFESVSGIIKAGSVDSGITSFPISLFLGAVFIGIALFVFLDLYETKESVEFVIESEIERGRAFVSKEEGKIFGRRDTNRRLLNKISGNLSEDEKKVVLEIAEREGIVKDKLRQTINLSKERIDYCILKLHRRGIINLRGSDENPSLYLSKWLK